MPWPRISGPVALLRGGGGALLQRGAKSKAKRACEKVEARWGITANHGGGYAYRLCKKGPGGNTALTEECFQKTHLAFVGDESWALGCNNKTSASRAKPCDDVMNYTFPAMSVPPQQAWHRGSS